MITYRVEDYEKDRQPILLSYVPLGEYFQCLVGDNEDIPSGVYQKICFQTKYDEFNVLNVITGEINRYRGNVLCIRLLIKDTVVFHEARFDRPVIQGSDN